jgi:hypothetical protein
MLIGMLKVRDLQLHIWGCCEGKWARPCDCDLEGSVENTKYIFVLQIV